MVGSPPGADQKFKRVCEQLGESRFNFVERLCRMVNLHMMDNGLGTMLAFRGPQGDVGDMLVQAGFADPVMDMETLTLTYSDAKTMMRELKAIGAHNATVGRPRGLTGRARWSRVLAALEAFRRDGRLPATYEVVYGHAWKPEPRFAADGRAVVRFQRDVRARGETRK